MPICKQLLVFWRNVRVKQPQLDPEDKGTTILWNMVNYLLIDIALNILTSHFVYLVSSLMELQWLQQPNGDIQCVFYTAVLSTAAVTECYGRSWLLCDKTAVLSATLKERHCIFILVGYFSCYIYNLWRINKDTNKTQTHLITKPRLIPCW